MAIWLTSDLHFNHDRGFIWQPRGFSCVEDMNETILRKFNEAVEPEDTVYILGDLMLGGQNEIGIEYIERLNGNKVIIAGNHDTKHRRKDLYEGVLHLPVFDATTLSYGGYHFYLSHFPTFTANLEKESLKQCTINLYGHTHQKGNFYNDIPFMYHVGVDSHDCYPVLLDDVIAEMEAKVRECLEYL